MAVTKQFLNRFPGTRCDVCGKTIDVGAPITWNRRGTVRKRWHATCDGSKLETETDNEHTKTLDYLKDHKDEYARIKAKYDNQSEIETQDKGYTNGFESHESLGTAVKQTESTHVETESTEVDTPKLNGSSAPKGDWLTGFAGALAPYLEDKLAAKLDRAEVLDIIQETLGSAVLMTATTVKVETVETGETKDLGIQHKSFATLLRICNTRINCWLTGPAGSGKTTACAKVAEALNLQFFHIGGMDNEYKLMGFIDAQGNVVNTQFKTWYREGGVLCMDEIDSWLPAATLALNAALDNGHCAFPDGLMNRHPDAIAIGCANTWGLGATNDYVGRMKQDAAFLERFPAQLNWEYDEALELAIAGNGDWTRRVQKLRANAKSKGLKVIISPRASKYGAKLLAAGLEQSLVEQLTVRKAMTSEQWESIQ